MSDILRYRIVRGPRELSAQPKRTLYYPRDEITIQPVDASSTLKRRTPKAKSSAPDGSNYFKLGISTSEAESKSVSFLGSAEAILPDASYAGDLFLSKLVAFSRALDDCEARIDSNAAQDLLLEWASLVDPTSGDNHAATIAADQRWNTLRSSVGDSLLATTLLRRFPLHIRFLTRLLLAIGVIEELALLEKGKTVPALKIAYLYLHRIVILPEFVTPASQAGPVKKAGAGNRFFVRSPAFSDHVVVREEWSCYVPGEIAHIENVLQGEKKERRHIRKEETEIAETTDSTTVTLDERDQQTTDRNSLQEEASTQTKMEVGVEGQVDVASQFGPTHIAAHFGASINYTAEEARRKSSQQSREIITRTVEKVETKVRQARSTRTLRQIKEFNGHLIDNSVTPSGNVVGIYRWVDKINRLQVFTYPHRFVLEFQIPEPAAFVRWVGATKPPTKVHVEPPPPFTNINGQPLTPTHIEPGTYLALVAKFKASGVLPPPDAAISVTSAKNFDSQAAQPNERNGIVQVVPTLSGTIELAIPNDYEAVAAHVSFGAAPALHKWRDQEESAGDRYVAEALGYHVVTAAVTFAGAVLKLTTNPNTTVRSTSGNTGVSYAAAWTTASGTVVGLPPTGVGLGTISAGITIGGTYRCSVSLRVECRPQPNIIEQWKLDTFDRLRSAHAAAESAYNEAIRSAEVRAGIVIEERSPLRNAQTVREELKRQVIEMLIGQNFDGFECHEQPVDAAKGPVNNLSQSAAVAPYIQFIEQAFEWENMTFVLYPYYWTDRSRWRDLQPLDSTDPMFLQFLRSGSARVVLPARPGFEWAVLFFSIFGQPWFGGTPPIPGDPLYVSIAQEIQEMVGSRDDGVPGDLWEVRLPTSLVWIDPNSDLPKCNTALKLAGTPSEDLCGASCAAQPAPPAPTP
jgi:hypothetical protein